jgi:integrase
VRKERRGEPVERVFRATFVTAWCERAVTGITPLDVLAIINAKKRKAPEVARALLTMISRFFNWAIGQQVYGITTSPCDRLKATKLIGARIPRTRRLSDLELFAFWRAAGKMGYPVGAAYRLLLLTGLRLNEAVEMSWSEFADDSAVIIPASRMKGTDVRAREHLLPLSRMAQDIIASLPRPKGARFLFSFDGGKRPLIMGTKPKCRLDQRMLSTLQALARRNGEDHTQVRLTPWVNHDLRRVVRSSLSALRVPHNVAEAVLAHRQHGIAGVYDLHEYEDEKREALDAWANRVASIVDPKPTTPGKIIRLRQR